MPRVPTPNCVRSETRRQRADRSRRQRERHAADGFARIKHGTVHGRNMGCPCEPCCTARNDYRNAWRHGTLHLREDQP